MYSREDVELALLALGEGMSKREAAELVGCGEDAVRAWAAGRLPHSCRPRERYREGARRGPRREEADMCARGTYDPPATGPLAGLTPDQIENLLLRAVLDDLKGAGSHPGSMSNRRKCELGERLRAATGLPLREITAFLRISSSYEYRRARLGRPDKYAALRARVRELFEEGSRNWGYRTVWARLRREGVSGSRRRWCAA